MKYNWEKLLDWALKIKPLEITMIANTYHLPARCTKLGYKSINGITVILIAF